MGTDSQMTALATECFVVVSKIGNLHIMKGITLFSDPLPSNASSEQARIDSDVSIPNVNHNANTSDTDNGIHVQA